MMLALVFICVLASAHAQLKQEHIEMFSDDVTFRDDGDSWILEADGIPNDDDPSSLPALPNQPTEQMHRFRIYKEPQFLDEPTCTPLGPIGFALNGVPFFNALTGQGCDAVRYEDFDDCNGHAAPRGDYHYHQLSTCVPDEGHMETPLKFHGVALDGILIYGPLDADGERITNDRLDECHGSDKILPDGTYAYFMNNEYPYIIGCFKGATQYTRPPRCLDLVEDEAFCSGDGRPGPPRTTEEPPYPPSGSQGPPCLYPALIVMVLMLVIFRP